MAMRLVNDISGKWNPDEERLKIARDKTVLAFQNLTRVRSMARPISEYTRKRNCDITSEPYEEKVRGIRRRISHNSRYRFVGSSDNYSICLLLDPHRSNYRILGI
jgi:hypothetical protein